jgi:hypothetical protein
LKGEEMDKFSSVVNDSLSLLSKNKEWVCRYEGYAKEIIENIGLIKGKKKTFHQWAPLYLYMNITNAKSSTPIFSLRYLGQNVALINVSENKVTMKNKGEIKNNNERDFRCSVDFHNKDWTSKEAKEFRKYFSNNPARQPNKGNKGNEEHRIESMFLTEFSKKQGKFENLKNIQPVKIAGVARFQMPTPLSASGSNIKYAKERGGGIDILARVRRDGRTTLCIVEVKYLKSEPKKAVTQGLYYAVFIRELLRSKSGDKWWHIFGFSGTVREKLTFYVCCVMPKKAEKNDTSFGKKQLFIENDTIELHYIYFSESEDGKINNIVTSLETEK